MGNAVLDGGAVAAVRGGACAGRFSVGAFWAVDWQTSCLSCALETVLSRGATVACVVGNALCVAIVTGGAGCAVGEKAHAHVLVVRSLGAVNGKAIGRAITSGGAILGHGARSKASGTLRARAASALGGLELICIVGAVLAGRRDGGSRWAVVTGRALPSCLRHDESNVDEGGIRVCAVVYGGGSNTLSSPAEVACSALAHYISVFAVLAAWARQALAASFQASHCAVRRVGAVGAC